jgi:FkbM family methyltransferase
MKPIYNIKALRRIVIPVLKLTAFDFDMSHPWVAGEKIHLNSFRHKGYWWHGRRREKRSMELFARIIEPSATVVEVGGHIGYISIYFASLVSQRGRVYVFEPGANNLPYIKRNIHRISNDKYANSIELVEAAVGERAGIAIFYEDSLTGQNNSLVQDFEGLNVNQKNSFVTTKVVKREVNVVTLDAFLSDVGVDFIKIDIEGYEWFALQGAAEVISRYRPALMVEVQASHDEIFNYFTEQNYILFNDELRTMRCSSELKQNIFCLHQEEHAGLIQDLGLK